MNFKETLNRVMEVYKNKNPKNNDKLYNKNLIKISNKFEYEIDKIVYILYDVIEETDITIEHLLRDYDLSIHGIRALNILVKVEKQNYLEYILGIKESKSLIVLKIKLESLRNNISKLENGYLKDKYLMSLYILEN